MHKRQKPKEDWKAGLRRERSHTLLPCSDGDRLVITMETKAYATYGLCRLFLWVLPSLQTAWRTATKVSKSYSNHL